MRKENIGSLIVWHLGFRKGALGSEFDIQLDDLSARFYALFGFNILEYFTAAKGSNEQQYAPNLNVKSYVQCSSQIYDRAPFESRSHQNHVVSISQKQSCAPNVFLAE